APAVSWHAAENCGAAAPSGIRRVQSGADFDDDAGAAGEVSAEALRKGVIYGRWLRAGGETGPSRRRWEHCRPIRLKPLQREVVRPIRELESESQNGNPGLHGLRGLCVRLSVSAKPVERPRRVRSTAADGS